MNQKTKLIVGVVIVLFGVAVLMMFQGGAPTEDAGDVARQPSVSGGMVVASDDGVATLIIPEGALPEGIAVSDISITSVPGEEISDDGAERLVFRLEPDGTELLAPVKVTIVIDPPAAGEPLDLPLVLHFSGDAVEAIDEVTIDFDEETGEGTISVEVMHFSLISYERAVALFDVAISPTSGTFTVGTTFNRTLIVTPGRGGYANTFLPWGKNREERASYLDVTYGIGNGTRWRVRRKTYNMLTNETDVLSPKSYELVEKDMAATEAYRHDYPFTCIGEGTADVIDRGAFIVSFTLQRETQWRDETRTSVDREARFIITNPDFEFGEEDDYECKKAPPPALTAPEVELELKVCGGFTGVPCPE